MIDYTELCIAKSVIEPKRGVRPSFTLYEVLTAVSLIYSSIRGIGRPTLMKMLGLGEASTRTLLRRLVEAGVIMSRGYGYTVTEKGMRIAEIVARYVLVLEKLPSDEICSECTVSGIVVRKPLSFLVRETPVLVVRDAVVREGAKGALVIASDEDGLYLPLPGGGRGDVPRHLMNALGNVMTSGDLAILSICDNTDTRYCTKTAFNAIFRLLTERCR